MLCFAVLCLIGYLKFGQQDVSCSDLTAEGLPGCWPPSTLPSTHHVSCLQDVLHTTRASVCLHKCLFLCTYVCLIHGANSEAAITHADCLQHASALEDLCVYVVHLAFAFYFLSASTGRPIAEDHSLHPQPRIVDPTHKSAHSVTR